MGKELLIIKAASDVCSAEIEHLQTIAKICGIGASTIEIGSMSDLREKIEIFRDIANKFDFVYLGAHANTEAFGEADGGRLYAWSELGAVFCQSDCLKSNAVLLLGCCRGGLKKVAMTLFRSCNRIDYVCGPRWLVIPADICVGFHVFIYNSIIRREQPSVAVDRASKATGYEFFCHDRAELEDEVVEFCEGQWVQLPAPDATIKSE